MGVDQYALDQLSPYAHDEFKSRWLDSEASQALWVIAYAFGYAEVLFGKNQRMAGKLANTDIWILVISVGLPGGRPRLDYVWPFFADGRLSLCLRWKPANTLSADALFNDSYLRHYSLQDSSLPTEDSAMALRAPLALTMVTRGPMNPVLSNTYLIHFC